ncbi:hypothetical protein ABFY27_12570 [Akkermansia massiliensis]
MAANKRGIQCGGMRPEARKMKKSMTGMEAFALHMTCSAVPK